VICTWQPTHDAHESVAPSPRPARPEYELRGSIDDHCHRLSCAGQRISMQARNMLYSAASGWAVALTGSGAWVSVPVLHVAVCSVDSRPGAFSLGVYSLARSRTWAPGPVGGCRWAAGTSCAGVPGASRAVGCRSGDGLVEQVCGVAAQDLLQRAGPLSWLIYRAVRADGSEPRRHYPQAGSGTQSPLLQIHPVRVCPRTRLTRSGRCGCPSPG
jgi:hypothetical protein